ncbi:MAG: HNH endonuclease [candidate division KSB1 bacterium]|nr:HNH endonuclease [candidate division KSB1 bacterium]MDZ7300741.1 HNH endonuclease [candidate division KSB1 bacterium]MDZ7309989.1 HNH endonuclease [candidate division KSB1 bacterium]
MPRPHIPASLRSAIADQAGRRCGYCQTAEAYTGMPLQVEHIVPLAAGGETVESNLWLACGLCNRNKGTQTHAIDPVNNELIALFNPRTQNWLEHFVWSEDGVHISGRTPCGRATVVALKLNNDYLILARKHWVSVGWHPPRQ